MSTKATREQLTNTLILQIIISIIVFILTIFYVIPPYEKLSLEIENTNEIIQKYENTINTGLSYTEIVNKVKNQSELLALIEGSPNETKKAITKIGNDPYLVWINNELNESSEDNKKLSIAKARINSILPNLGSTNTINSDEAKKSILRRYITFIETKIFQKFNIESNATLGITNIQYGKKGGSLPESIGYFDTEISFTATNKDILDMITYIHTLGNPEILSASGSNLIPEIMSNPLATIENFSLENRLNMINASNENTGRMTLRFYIRGSSLNDISYLSDTVEKRKKELNIKLNTALEVCKKNTCNKREEIEKTFKKYNEFVRITSKQKDKIGTDMIYALSAEINTIDAIEKELNILIK